MQAGLASLGSSSPGPGQGQGGVKTGSTPVPGVQFAHRIQSQKLFWPHALDINAQDSLPKELATHLSTLSPGVQIPISPVVF